MSGGSFEYLYLKEGIDLLDRIDILEQMAQQIDEYVPNCKASADTRVLLDALRSILQQLDSLPGSELSKVFHAVEWAVSHDTSAQEAIEAIQKYERLHP